MGSRGWIFEIKDRAQAKALQKWYANVERDERAMWLLDFAYHVRFPKTGRQFICINSDGSGCVDHLARYGYMLQPSLLGEDPKWDNARGYGRLSTAQFAPQFDATEADFAAGAAEMKRPKHDRLVVEAYVRVRDQEEFAELMFWLGDLRRDEQLRVVPSIGTAYCLHRDGHARDFCQYVGMLERAAFDRLVKMFGADRVTQDAPALDGWAFCTVWDLNWNPSQDHPLEVREYPGGDFAAKPIVHKVTSLEA